LIAVSGTVALVEAGVGPLPFCGGRSDAATPNDDDGGDDEGGSEFLAPTVTGTTADTIDVLK
jgi:hypothetical protein